MPIGTITQDVSTIPAPPHRGIDVQTQFVIKQEDFQDHLQGTTVKELNTLRAQLNTRIGEINSTATTMNGYANTASAGASTATTKAGEASTSASGALTSRNQAETFKNNASTSASTATTKASEASASALSASTSASTATTKASEASASALSASTSASTASTSASTATTKASEASASALSASTSASTATKKAGEASASASQALTSRNQAETFAQQASASALSVDTNNIVHRTGAETIAGVKTFSSNIVGNITGNAGTATSLQGDESNWASYRSRSVANMLGWKNYGNGHCIFDASAGTTPNGVAVNNTNPSVPWTKSYPTLMGWNGDVTHGVRVDSSRYADSAATCSGNSATATFATTADNANKLVGKNWYWSGQGGQPTWLWGGSDGANMYVYNPSNFSVNYANTAGSVNSITYNAAAWGAAQLPCGEIGTYAFLSITPNNKAISSGANYAGSSLRYSGVSIAASSTGPVSSGGIGETTSTGTWKAMGLCNSINSGHSSTLFLRIA